MDNRLADLALLVDEYQTLAYDCGSLSRGTAAPRWEVIESRLARDAEWTPDAARRLSKLVRHYGSFMLRNAAALAIALDFEDGDLGL